MSEEILVSTFTAMRRKLIQLAARFSTASSDADDALQETFCRLWPRKDDIKTNKEAEALSITTLKNIIIDQHRKRKIETIRIDEEHDTLDEESSDREELFNEVEEIIEKELTPLQKQILESREYKGEPLESIAERLGMQQTAVRMQLSRARKKIRECYRRRNAI